MSVQIPPSSRATRTRASARMMECQDIPPRLWEYLDGRLDTRSCRRLREHLAACPQCAGYASFQRAVFRSLAECRPEVSAPDAEARRARIRRRLGLERE